MIRRLDSTNNSVELAGKIASPVKLAYEINGRPFFETTIACQRQSGIWDEIPAILPGDLIGDVQPEVDQPIFVRGYFYSKSVSDGQRNHLRLFILAKTVEFPEQVYYKNEIYLDGLLCRKAALRVTPKLQNRITDMFLAVNRPNGKGNYIPCIAWNKNAVWASGLEAGTRLIINGRIQSRAYRKKISDEEFETRTAYEVSISQIERKRGEEEDE